MGDSGRDAADDVRVIVVADMLFASRVRGAAVAVGVAVATAGRPAAVSAKLASGTVRLLLVDLELRTGDPIAVIRLARSDPAHSGLVIVGFASHTNVAAITAGREAGADRVLARSAFIRTLPELLLEANNP